MSDRYAEIPEAEVQPARRSIWERMSIVWIVPLGALLLALALAWQAYSDRGPVIEISFANGSGIAAGETELRFREVGVGQVERVGFTEGLGRVLVTVRVDEEVASYIDDGAQFWVVRPEVTAEGVQGLSTVLSGVYIEGSWDGAQGAFVDSHIGLDVPPVARPDEAGLRVVLRTETGRGLTAGAPILYRGLEVGVVGQPRIASDGISVLADAFIRDPHAGRLTDRSRFWSVSGFSLDIGPQGASLNFASLASLVRGGLSFETVVSGGAPVVEGAVFDIYDNREAAVASLFSQDDANAPRLNVTAVFEDNVAGLTTGADVELQGLRIGEVVDLSGQVDPERFGDDRVRLVATLSIRLDQISMSGDDDAREEVLSFLETRVAEGLRARLANASLLTGGLKVELVEMPDAEPAAFDRDAEPFPVIPTAPAEIEDVAGAAQGLIARVNNLPVEEVLQNTIAFLESARGLIEDGAIQRASGEVVGLVEEVRAVVGSEQVQALPERVAATLDTLDAAVAEATGVMQEMRAEGIVASLNEAVVAAGNAADEVGAAVEGIPALIERIDAVAARAQALALEELVDQASGVLADARGILGTEDARALPGQLGQTLDSLSATVDEARDVLAEFRTEDSVARLSATLDAASAAADDVSAAVADVPALVERIDAVAARAETLEFEALLDEIAQLAAAARGVLDTEGARDLPERVGSALEEVEAAVAELRAGGTVENVNEALASARRAADSIAATAEDLPALVERTAAALEEAEATFATLGEAGSLNREARVALREVGRAADAVRSLARAIERRPNSLLTGR